MAHSLARTNSGQDWCHNLGVIKDQDGAAAVTAIKALALTQFAFFINAAVMLRKRNAINKGG